MATGAAQNRLQKLQAENKRLRQENNALRAQLKPSSPPTGNFWRRLGLLFCTALAVALLFISNLLLWGGNTLVKTDRYVEATAPLIQNQDIQVAIAHRATERLYDQVDIEQLLTDALPPRADFAAPALADRVVQYTDDTIQKIVARPQFQDRWNEAQRRAHERFITAASEHGSDGTIDLSEVYTDISDRLKDTRLAFLADRSLPPDVGSIQIVSGSWLTALQKTIQNIDAWRFFSLLFLVAFSALAVWLSGNRRRTVITMGGLFAGTMLMTLIGLRLGKEIAAAEVAAPYTEAVRQAYGIITRSLVVQTYVVLAISLVMVFVAWLSGPSAGSQALRRRIEQLFAGKLHAALFGKGENAFTRWLGRHKRTLQWLTLALVAITALFTRVTPAVLITQLLVVTVLVLLVEILAAPAD